MKAPIPSPRPQDLGREWEAEVAELVGGKIQPGSGNRVQAKLDVRSSDLVLSCKNTVHDSFRLTRDDLEETLSFTSGTAGVGQHVLTAMAININGRKVGVVDLDALIELLRSPAQLIPSTSQDDLRATARTSPLLR